MRRHTRTVLLLVLALAALPAAVALAKKAPVDLHGTSWALDTKVQMKLKGAGGYKGEGQVTLYFGPRGGAVLLDDFQFALADADGVFLHGNWTDPKAKGSPILNISLSDIEDFLVDDVTEVLEDQFNTVSNVSVGVTKQKVKCKCVPGKKASLSTKVSFIGSAVLDGEYQEGKGSFSAKGKGGQI